MNRTRFITIAVSCCVAAFCFALPASRASETKPAQKELTFSKDVAPIFFKHCAECHRPGEAAPMSLLTYKDTRPWAKSIREQVAKRQMPPWHADPHVQTFKNDRRLTQAEIDTIVAWIDGGAKEGNAKDMPPAPKFEDGWNIGKPDAIIAMPEEYTLAASGPDEIQYFEVDPGFKEDKYVRLAEARAGNRQIVHHIIAFIVPPAKGSDTMAKLSPEERRKMREQFEKESIFYQEGNLTKVKMDAPVYDDGCATPSGGGGFKRDGSGRDGEGGLLVGWAPGMPPANWGAGVVKKIPAGSKIRFQLHYSKAAGSVQKDRSSIGLIFAHGPGEKLAMTKGVSNHYFKIPAGAEHHRVTACWTADRDLQLINTMPHMHLRGKAMEIKAIFPDGRSEVVLNVPQYDFGWQTVYYYKQPLPIPKGTKFVVTAIYDNSTRNKLNPDPTKVIRWGDPTYEDMMIGWLEFSVDAKKEAATAMKTNGAER